MWILLALWCYTSTTLVCLVVTTTACSLDQRRAHPPFKAAALFYTLPVQTVKLTVKTTLQGSLSSVLLQQDSPPPKQGVLCPFYLFKPQSPLLCPQSLEGFQLIQPSGQLELVWGGSQPHWGPWDPDQLWGDILRKPPRQKCHQKTIQQLPHGTPLDNHLRLM